MPNSAWLACVLERAHLPRALQPVRQTPGAPGIDGMSVDELPDYLRNPWPEIRAPRLAGHYGPPPMRGVERPKDNGRG
jgi:retron-type reverse transcriptase